MVFLLFIPPTYKNSWTIVTDSDLALFLRFIDLDLKNSEMVQIPRECFGFLKWLLPIRESMVLNNYDKPKLSLAREACGIIASKRERGNFDV